MDNKEPELDNEEPSSAFDLPEGTSDMPESALDLAEGTSGSPESFPDLPEGTSGSPESASGTPERSRIRTRAIRILGNRQMSSQKVERRLISKGESEKAARETVQWLEDIGALNDTEHAAEIVSHYSSKGYGLARIKDELYRRGIPRDLWDDALANQTDAETGEAVFQFLEKKLRGHHGDADPALWKKELRRATDALCRRGFSYEEARTAVNEYLESIENTEEFQSDN